MDVTRNTSTGSRLLTEKVIDIGNFDGRVMAEATTGERTSSVRIRATPKPATRSTGGPGGPGGTAAKRTTGPKPLPRNVPLMVVGAVLAVAGIVFASYAAFQLYGTNVLAARSQEDLAAEFAARQQLGPPAYVPPGVQPAGAIDPADFSRNDVPVVVASLDQAPPPPPESAVDWVSEAPPEHGTSLGHLLIPKIGLDWIVVEGVNVADLKKGPGHMPNSAMPGQYGNSVISGHRTTYGAPFNRLDELAAGDRFTLETLIGVHTYEVVSLAVVLPSAEWVTTQWEGSWLTFTTCNPEYSSRQRLIVFSKLVNGPNFEAVTAEFGTAYPPPTGAMAPPLPISWPGATSTTTSTIPATTTTEPTTTTTTEPSPTTTVEETTTTTEPTTTTTTEPSPTTTVEETTTTTEP